MSNVRVQEPVSPPRRRTVLVVDDDSEILNVLEEVLGQAGYEVVCASNGSAALDYVRNAPPPDVVLLDLFMPLMNGWEFVREVSASERTAHIPILVLTAAGPHWGYPMPMHRVLHKPVQSDRLLQALRQVCAD